MSVNLIQENYWIYVEFLHAEYGSEQIVIIDSSRPSYIFLISNLVLVSLVKFGSDTVREVALDGKRVAVFLFAFLADFLADAEILIDSLFALNEASLALGGAIELPELRHGFHEREVKAVKMLHVINSASDIAEAPLGQCGLA